MCLFVCHLFVLYLCMRLCVRVCVCICLVVYVFCSVQCVYSGRKEYKGEGGSVGEVGVSTLYLKDR